MIADCPKGSFYLLRWPKEVCRDRP